MVINDPMVKAYKRNCPWNLCKMTGVRQAQTIFDINSVAHKKRKGPTMESSLGAGAIAGLSACLLLQPLDLVKTRLQEPTDLKSSRRIPSIIRDVIRQHGITGLWRGTRKPFIFDSYV